IYLYTLISHRLRMLYKFYFFFQAEDGIRDRNVTGVQTCALPISNFEIVSLRLIARHLQLEMHSDHVNNASYNSLLSMGRCPESLLNFFRFLPCYSFEAS